MRDGAQRRAQSAERRVTSAERGSHRPGTRLAAIEALRDIANRLEACEDDGGLVHVSVSWHESRTAEEAVSRARVLGATRIGDALGNDRCVYRCVFFPDELRGDVVRLLSEGEVSHG